MSGAAAEPAVSPIAQTPELGWCHGGECSWSITRSQTLVRREPAATLYRLSLLGGSAPEGEDERISWNRQPHEVFVLCAPRRPAVIMAEGGAFQVDLLDFVNGPAGNLESSANLYVRTCHPGEDWAAAGFAARFGYRAQDDAPEIRIDRPEDIFRFAR